MGMLCPSPEKICFFWLKYTMSILTPFLPSLAIPPSPLNTPNTKNAPYQRFFVFGWFISTLKPLSPALVGMFVVSSRLKHQNMENMCCIACFSCSMASLPHPSARTRKLCTCRHNFHVQALHYPRHKNATPVSCSSCLECPPPFPPPSTT